MHVCELACGAYRIPGVAWNRFVRRVGFGYLKKLRTLGKQKSLLSSSLHCDGGYKQGFLQNYKSSWFRIPAVSAINPCSDQPLYSTEQPLLWPLLFAVGAGTYV